MPVEISAPGDLNLTPPRIRNNSCYEKVGDLSEIWGFYGDFEGKKKTLAYGDERYSEIGFNSRPFKGRFMCGRCKL